MKKMKKIILGLIATFGISIVSFGQVTLENSYYSKIYSTVNGFNTENGLNYFTVDNISNQLKIYNSTHNLIKTVNIPVDANSFINHIYLPTDKLFNSDNLIEFIVHLNNGPTNNNMFLMNEDGIVLQQFGNKSEAKVIKSTSGVYKLDLKIYDNGYYDFIYTLTGTLSVAQQEMLGKQFISFPNPTENKITITNNLENGQNGTLEVFDVNGKKVIQKNVIGENGEINLDVIELSSGVYIYKLNGQTNRFIKK